MSGANQTDSEHIRTPTEIRRIVREYVNALERTIHVDRVILYGSYAHGNPHQWSDIDLAVISRDFASKDRWDRQAILGIAKHNNPILLEAMIESLGYSVAEYNHAHPLTFLGEIKRTGKVIYTRRPARPRRSSPNGRRTHKSRTSLRRARRAKPASV